jgi:hypothetical protein
MEIDDMEEIYATDETHETPFWFRKCALEYVLRRHCQDGLEGENVRHFGLDTSGTSAKLQDLVNNKITTWMTEYLNRCTAEATRKAEARIEAGELVLEADDPGSDKFLLEVCEDDIEDGLRAVARRFDLL